jgi:hypothetical protein
MQWRQKRTAKKRRAAEEKGREARVAEAKSSRLKHHALHVGVVRVVGGDGGGPQKQWLLVKCRALCRAWGELG